MINLMHLFRVALAVVWLAMISATAAEAQTESATEGASAQGPGSGTQAPAQDRQAQDTQGQVPQDQDMHDPEEQDSDIQDPVLAEQFTLSIEQLPLASVIEVLAEEWALTVSAESLPDVQVSLELQDVSLQEVLGKLLFPHHLDFRLTNGVLRIDAPETLLLEDDARRQHQEALMALETVYLQVNYANAQAIAELIHADGASLLSQRGTLQVDARTNTLIIRDIAGRIEDVRQLLQTLDVPVSQVLIEARIVSATLDTGRELGVRWGLNPVEDMEVSGRQVSLEATHRQASQAAVAIFRSSRLLEWEIAALEHQGEAELIARPRILTQDNSTATIRSGLRIPYQAQAGGTAGGSITQFVDAVLALEVTPMITPDERIILQLHLQQDSVASGAGDAPAINTNTIATHVLIDDTDTLVLGGIFREEQVRNEMATPVLGRIPGLGHLFRRETFTRQRTELLIFITPRIVELSADCC